MYKTVSRFVGTGRTWLQCLLSRLYNLALSTLLGGYVSSVEVPSVLISSFTESLKGEESQFIHINPEFSLLEQSE